jgi:membrane associated rhomboid family serine protease
MKLKLVSFESTFTIILILVSFIGITLSTTILPGFNETFFCAHGHKIDLGIITHIFGHSSWKHFLNNVVFIAMIGPSVEDKYGTVYLMFMTLITSLITGICTSIVGCNSYGMSTIVYMYVILNTFQSDKGGIPFTSIILLLAYVLPEVIKVFSANDLIGHREHVLGAICGLLFGIITKVLSKVLREETH